MIDPKTVFKFELLKVESNADFASARWKIAPDFPYLNGHFPNQPIVPGIAIIDAATELIRQARRTDLTLAKVKNAKFTNPLTPDQVVEIEAMRVIDNEWTIDFKVMAASVARLLLLFET